MALPELTSEDRIFLVQISDGKSYAQCEWAKKHTDKLVKLGLVKCVSHPHRTFQITQAGKDAVK